MAKTPAPSRKPASKSRTPVRRSRPPESKPATASRWKLEERMPLRPERLEEERARYPERMARWEAAKATAESRKEHEQEDQQHRGTCEVRKGCEHPSHVPPRRELREETVRDRRHLRTCLLEDPDCLDDSHLLPPHPLEATQEYCCEYKCFPRWDVRHLTECVCTPVAVRERRQRELRRFGKQAFSGKGDGFGSVTIVRTDYLSDSVRWGLSFQVYDEALHG